MRILLIAFAWLSFAPPLLANNIEREAGDKNCKVIFQGKGEVASLRWSGGCHGGYAEGTGVLEWKFAGNASMSRYEGAMKQGRWHGDGYLELAGGFEYEGGFSEGKYHGTGTLVTSFRRYDGNFVAGKPDGFGKEVRMLGGSYEGLWKAGKFHGKGTAAYAGGRTVTTEFVEGRRATQAAVAPSSTGVPFSSSYHELSAEEKQVVRDMYFLDDDDEPPYPANGTKQLYQRIITAQQKRKYQGLTELAVDIDSQGIPTSVTVFASPDPKMATWISAVLMAEQYKPALCQGKPCAMRFPVRILLSVADF